MGLEKMAGTGVLLSGLSINGRELGSCFETMRLEQSGAAREEQELARFELALLSSGLPHELQAAVRELGPDQGGQALRWLLKPMKPRAVLRTVQRRAWTRYGWLEWTIGLPGM